MADSVVTSADGVVHITAEVELPDTDQDEPEDAAQPADSNEATEALVGAGRAVGRVLGGIWDAIKPDDSAQRTESEEE